MYTSTQSNEHACTAFTYVGKAESNHVCCMFYCIWHLGAFCYFYFIFGNINYFSAELHNTAYFALFNTSYSGHRVLDELISQIKYVK